MTQTFLRVFLVTLIFSCSNNKQNTFAIYGDTDRVGDAILLKIDPNGNLLIT